MISQAIVPSWIGGFEKKAWIEIASVICGSLILALLAQISVLLPFTPVPITGQTFGVATLALLWGRNRATVTFVLYLAEGAFGLPVFTQFKSGLLLGPTAGYLVGMLVSCFVIGSLADRGNAKNFKWALFSCVCGSICVFTGGLIGLSHFLPASQLLKSGLLPFIPGDVIKNILAAGTGYLISNSKKSA